MKYRNVPPSLELALIMEVRKYGVELKSFVYDGQFAWYYHSIWVKKHRINITITEIENNADDDNATIRGNTA